MLGSLSGDSNQETLIGWYPLAQNSEMRGRDERSSTFSFPLVTLRGFGGQGYVEVGLDVANNVC